MLTLYTLKKNSIPKIKKPHKLLKRCNTEMLSDPSTLFLTVIKWYGKIFAFAYFSLRRQHLKSDGGNFIFNILT